MEIERGVLEFRRGRNEGVVLRLTKGGEELDSPLYLSVRAICRLVCTL